MLKISRKPRINYTEAQRALMWDRWQNGDSMHEIARLFDRSHPAISRILTLNGGFRPPDTKRSHLALTLCEWDALKPLGLVVAIDVHAVQKKNVEMDKVN